MATLALALEAQDELGEAAERGRQDAVLGLQAKLGAGQPEGRDRFVDRAVGLRPRFVLGDPRAPERQAGGAVIAPPGRDGRVAYGPSGVSANSPSRLGSPFSDDGCPHVALVAGPYAPPLVGLRSLKRAASSEPPVASPALYE